MRKIVYFLATLGMTMTVSCGSGNSSAQREQEAQDSALAWSDADIGVCWIPGIPHCNPIETNKQ